MIFIDSNIPMYLVGAPHRHKSDAQRLLERSIAAGERLVTSAEVLQEILHRYVAVQRRDAIQPALDAVLGVVDEVFAIERIDVEQAKRVLDGSPVLSARDALHVAVMQRRDVSHIMSFDTAFDGISGIERLR
ncbi:MAG TPA: type II toxin-antitoxin system VapC family toxin [Longimicrobiales bacterium]|nr:type II toxin-antitoxin system VapC family toxin [Longimicrobiales bacterium]